MTTIAFLGAFLFSMFGFRADHRMLSLAARRKFLSVSELEIIPKGFYFYFLSNKRNRPEYKYTAYARIALRISILAFPIIITIICLVIMTINLMYMSINTSENYGIFQIMMAILCIGASIWSILVANSVRKDINEFPVSDYLLQSDPGVQNSGFRVMDKEPKAFLFDEDELGLPEEYLSSPEKAKEALILMGMIDENGDLMPGYRPIDTSKTRTKSAAQIIRDFELSRK